MLEQAPRVVERVVVVHGAGDVGEGAEVVAGVPLGLGGGEARHGEAGGQRARELLGAQPLPRDDAEAAHQSRHQGEQARGQGPVTPRPRHDVPHRSGRARANRDSLQVTVELLRHLMGRGEALRGVRIHAAQAQDLEVEGHLRPDRARLGRPPRANVVEHLQGIRAQVGRASRQHLVQDRAEPVDVGAYGEGIHAFARDFRGHEGGGSDGPDGAGAGDRVVEVAGEPEVAELGVVVAGQEDVAGLDVAVEDAGVVGAGEGLGDGQGPACGLLGRGRVVGQPLGQRSALDELHLDEAAAILLPGGMDLDDGPVLKAREDPRLR